jgi:hypothetical protein
MLNEQLTIYMRFLHNILLEVTLVNCGAKGATTTTIRKPSADATLRLSVCEIKMKMRVKVEE